MEIGIEDVRQLTFELWIERRENDRLRAANEELKRLLQQVQQPADGSSE